MKHLVFGTGLIGGFLGGGLLSAGYNVVFLGRDKQRVAMQCGVTISALNGYSTHVSAPKFWQSTTEETYDVLWLAVKCTAVEAAIEQIKSLLHPKSIIICCQNGFGSERFIKQALPEVTVLNAIVGFNVAASSGNHLHRSTDGQLVVQSHPLVNSAVEGLNSQILPAHISQDIEADRWAKLQLNLANPVNALSDIPTKAMTEDRDYRLVIAALMRELLRVTHAMNLSLPKLTALPANWLPTVLDLPNFIYLKLAQKTLAIDPSARVSMWWDLSQGRQSEIVFLNQAVVDTGKELGVQCPYNQAIVNLILQVERNERQIGISGKQLQSLIGLT